MMVGVGLFGVLTGFLANAFLKQRHQVEKKPEITLESLSRQINALQKEVTKLKKK